MVPAKFVAVLLAAVVVNMAAAIPSDHKNTEEVEDHCTASMIRALGVLRGVVSLIEASEGFQNQTQADLDACKLEAKPEQLDECEQEVKLESTLRGAKLLKAQVLVGTVGKAVMLHLQTACHPPSNRTPEDREPTLQNLLVSFTIDNVLKPKDLNDCFEALEAGRGDLTELGRLIDESADLLVNILLQIQRCVDENHGDTKKCAKDILLSNSDAVSAALEKNLRWKEGAEPNLDNIAVCLA